MIDLVGAGETMAIVQVYRPAGEAGGFRLLGDELLLDERGTVLPRAVANPVIVSLREGAADHPGIEERWREWNTGRDPANPLVK